MKDILEVAQRRGTPVLLLCRLVPSLNVPADVHQRCAEVGSVPLLLSFDNADFNRVAGCTVEEDRVGVTLSFAGRGLWRCEIFYTLVHQVTVANPEYTGEIPARADVLPDNVRPLRRPASEK